MKKNLNSFITWFLVALFFVGILLGAYSLNTAFYPHSAMGSFCVFLGGIFVGVAAYYIIHSQSCLNEKYDVKKVEEVIQKFRDNEE